MSRGSDGIEQSRAEQAEPQASARLGRLLTKQLKSHGQIRRDSDESGREWLLRDGQRVH